MADVRQLTVSLLLDSTNFDKNIRLINQSVKEAESEFKLLGAGTEDFEKTLGGMREKAKLLSKQMDAQNKIVKQYDERLKSANKQLNEQKAQYDALKEKYRAAGEALDEYNEEIRETEEALKAAKAAGNDPLAIEALETKLKGQREQAAAAAEAYKKLGGQVTSVETAMYKSNAAVSSATVGLNNAKAKAKEVAQELAKTESAWYRSGVAMQSWAEEAKGAAAAVESTGNALTRKITTPLIGLGTAAVKASIDYESAFAGVRKTVNATGEDAEEFFGQLSDSVIQMSKELATGAGDIAEVMAIAGQLGIENDQLEEFTDTIVRLGMSTNLAGEEAASAMARFANVTGMQQSMFDEMGSTLVHLGNNFATTEAEIMNMATRIAAAGSQVGLSEQEILAFATALSSLGLEAEAGGSAFSTALKKMEVAVETGSKALGDFAKVAGLTKEGFAALWQSDPAGAFEAFIVGLSKMDEEGMSAIAVLDEIGITQLRLSDTLLRTANATELIDSAIQSANTAWAENNALQKESDTRLQTTASRLTNIKNSLVAVGIEFADTMSGAVEWAVEQLQKAVDWLDGLDEATKRNIVTWAAYAAAAGPVISVLGKIGGAMVSTIGTVGRFAKAIGEIGAAFKTTGSLASALAAGLGPGGKLMLGLGVAAAAVAALIALYKKLEENKPDFSIDSSEIEKYKIDVEAVKAKIEVDTEVDIKGEITGLGEKFKEILNDGVPETKEVREAMQADVDAAVTEAYKVIEESFAAKKKELDGLFESGIIDEETYDASVATLYDQATAMQTDLTAKSNAVTSYLTTLCNQNRATTDAEIEQLNKLLEALGQTADAVIRANDAQKEAYEWAYEKTRLGIGDEKDAQMAAEYIEYVADQKLKEIDAEEQALRQINAQSAEGLDEEGRIQLAEQETEALEKLEEKRKAVNRQKLADYGNILPGMFSGTDISMQEVEEAAEAAEKIENAGAKIEDGIGLIDRFNVDFAGKMTGLDYNQYIEALEGFIDKLDESGLMEDGSPLMSVLATLAEQGMIPQEILQSTEGTAAALAILVQAAQETAEQLPGTVQGQASQIMPGMAAGIEETKGQAVGALESAAGEMAEVIPDEFEEHSPSKKAYGWGMNVMLGMRNGILAGRSGVIQAMRSAARAAVNAAKDELDIHSPSKVMENEVGAEATRGAARGMIKEAKKQAELIRNAYRQLTGEAQAGAISGAGSRRTYNSESSVTVTGNTFVIRDQTDVQALAIEIAALGRQNQRGKGLRMA